MDSLLSLTSFTCTPIAITPLSPSTTFSFFNFRPTTTCLSSSYTSPPWNSPRTPIWVLQTIKKVASLHTHKWLSSFQACTTDADKAMEEWNGCYLQNRGGLGVALLSVTANAKLRISPFVATLAANPTFVSGLLAWLIAQSMKVFLNFFVERTWDLKLLFASGGMPSSHSALCTALTTSVALCHGVADSLFPVCLGFSLIVMYDAIGVRRHAGMQAEVLNMIVADLFKGHPISERKLKELLGHTPSQVIAGALLGFLVACFCCQACVVGT
ncbi:uncharacterized protein LOC107491944 isoform X1 [Arachis duranensis]|uniref:Uncharacterized protein LOC107491944 isoform X1 n=1 Tax=Arachis duranensis TaxID=130453 RepID=A0A6P4DKF5_ARADU|nr:uncharacterized protein LOC107491944 isoform X1 [Arachis duranensis]